MTARVTLAGGGSRRPSRRAPSLSPWQRPKARQFVERAHGTSRARVLGEVPSATPPMIWRRRRTGGGTGRTDGVIWPSRGSVEPPGARYSELSVLQAEYYKSRRRHS